MDNGDFTSSLILNTSQDAAMDVDFMELFLGGCWVETTEQYNILQPGPSTSATPFLPPLETNSNLLTLEPNQTPFDEEAETLNLWGNPPPVFSQALTSFGQTDDFLIEGNDMNKGWWLAPSPTIDSSASLDVKKRLIRAIKQLRESTKDRNALIQIWVPEKREGKKVLTTTDQPFAVGPDCKSLEYYRNVSEKYQFPAEEDSKESIGLPGRVYLNKMHEWTPDVRLFKSSEYPRISYAHQYNVQGSLALPVFDRGSGNCLGVVEIVTTIQQINYKSDLEQIHKALEAFDLRSSEISSPGNIKACNDLYHPALPEIVEVLTSVCRAHRLPLAQTWAPCLQHDIGKSLHSGRNHAHCVSILDSAFYATDPQILEFHEACSEHNLYERQGVVGKALTTEEPCFESNVTAYTKTEYPLSHHAKMFNLHAAVAVRLKSVHTGSAEFVLEFFLPTECQSVEEQRQMCSALSYSLQQAGKNLRSLTGSKLKEDVLLPVKKAVAASKGKLVEEEKKCSPPKEFSHENPSWISNMMGSQQKGKGVSVSLNFKKKEAQEEFKVTTLWNKFENESSHSQVFHDFGKRRQDSVGKGFIENGGDTSSMSAQYSSRSRKTGEKRRTKTEKTISLQVLRQYFAGSLKDAAKSIGVCPTTLKRICRQHGITRWPSRKIKKVGHSLRKIQLVIDSVQGAEGALQIGNFYSSYPELNSPNLSGATPTFSSLKMPLPDQLVQSNLHQHNGTLFSLGGTSSKSPSSSCSQSSSSSLCYSTGANPQPSAANALLAEDQLVGGLKRARSDAELHIPKQEETVALARAHSHKSLGQHPILDILPSLAKNRNWGLKEGNAFRVKATFGEEKVRFSLQHDWVYVDLQQEIVRRFNLDDVSRMDLKYLDDDSEWVLLTCDADLEECIDICKSCKRHTIKLSVHLASHPNLGSSLGSIGPGLS